MDVTDLEQSLDDAHITSPTELSVIDIGPIVDCGKEDVVREFKSGLSTRGEEFSELIVPEIEYPTVSLDPPEARLLRLHPTDDVSSHVRCDLEIYPLENIPSFIAIKNARGYRGFREPIEVNGQALIISSALERFLRYIRTKIDKPVRIWVRYACIVEMSDVSPWGEGNFDPQEQKAYWTREFSDKMYTMASQVFNMHEVNNRLIENGYFEKAIDRRYENWTKEWDDAPKEVVLPRIWPIRLGTDSTNMLPTMEYQYMSLDMVADEIRILGIMPAEDTAAPIVITVAHCPIKCEVTYMALSYRWGTEQMAEKIIINGQYKLIRKNLAEAIRALRMTDKVVPMWIDAISINQDDIAERNRQVRRMGKIYDSATNVYSYVGQPTDDTVAALEFVHELNQHVVIQTNNLGEFHFGRPDHIGDGSCDGENIIKPDRLVQLCAALYKYLTKQYFRRGWVLQEVAWASNPVVISGRLGQWFKNLDKATHHLCDMMTRHPSLAGKMQDADPSLENVDIDMLAYPRKLFYFRYLLSDGWGGGDFMISPFYTFGGESPGFLEALILARDFECTDPRDHIYALWSLARDKTGLNFQPEYNKPYEHVYTGSTQAWIEQHQRLDIIGAVETTRGNAEFYKHAPTWCPNWNVPATTGCLVRKDYIPNRMMSILGDQGGKLYSADGNIDQDSFETPMISFEGNELRCHGIVLGHIQAIFCDAPDILPGQGPKAIWRFQNWPQDLVDFYKKFDLQTYEDTHRAAHAMCHGDSIPAWPSVAESGYEPSQWRSHDKYLCLPSLSRHVTVLGRSYDRTQAAIALTMVLRGRRPFVTDNGYMGLAPEYITEEDGYLATKWSVAVVAGCSVPLLLRERVNGTYQLIGTCFVQGWMQGEWTEKLGAESPKQFWQAVEGTARIVIS